jgi:hypothetical protein
MSLRVTKGLRFLATLQTALSSSRMAAIRAGLAGFPAARRRC